MKHKFFIVPCSVLLATMILFSACSKEGPTGPAGATGATGATGPQGPAGPAGPAGTANVKYSDWLNVTFDTGQINGTDTTWIGQINAPDLADSILSKGEVHVYLNINTPSAPTIVPLPLDAATFGVVLTPVFEVGKITLISNANLSSVVSTTDTALQYRYVLIPGGTAATSGETGSMKKIDWNDYNQVKSFLDLKN